MGNKISANAMRLGVNKTWKSVWFSQRKEYIEALHHDIKIRKLVTEKLNIAGLDSIAIKRAESSVEIEVFVARPGVAIGRGGTGLDQLKEDIKKMVKKPVEIKISEVKKPDLSARIVARSIADGIEKRLPMKPMVENAKNKAILGGAKGIRITVSGRIGGASQARTVKSSQGRIPVQTIKANIDYAEERAATNDYGIFGIKVWVYKEA